MVKYKLFDHMLQQKHLLIAGCTGSGKSVLLNGLIYNALFDGPQTVQFVMIDVKKVELIQYKNLPHVLCYADTVPGAVNALDCTVNECMKRFDYMQKQRIKKFDGPHLYIVIDELADLMTTAKKQVTPLLQRICQLGRAAGIHVWASTQCPLASIIPTAIKVNFDSRIGLHVISKQDSRNILECTGLEQLPAYGFCWYRYPGNTVKTSIPYVTDDMIDEMVRHWKPPFKLFE